MRIGKYLKIFGFFVCWCLIEKKVGIVNLGFVKINLFDYVLCYLSFD